MGKIHNAGWHIEFKGLRLIRSNYDRPGYWAPLLQPDGLPSRNNELHGRFY